jgi:tRNA G46 methylase TrmB
MSSLSVKNVTARYDGKVNSTAQTQLPDTTPAVIQTEQASPHADLERIVLHHLGHPWRKPCPNHTQRAFEQLQSHYGGNPRPLILDSYCGTGMSTAVLAAQHPEALVVGIDQSASRLAKHQAVGHQNYLLLRAEAESFWRCLVDAEMPLAAHWMLYPNPWPKASQLRRRVHGHGAFPLLAKLGGELEMRSNWQVYAAEFAQAAELIGLSGTLETFTPDPPHTLFERKYHERGQTLWRFQGTFSR